MDERALTERLITYETSALEGMQSAAGFVKGWLEARDIEVMSDTHNGRPVLAATVGAATGPTVVFHGHADVVPGRAGQFQPRVEGERLFGRGAYDMKGGLAAMMCATRDLAAQHDVRVHFLCVSDEECDDVGETGSDHLIAAGYTGDFAITGEPTNLDIGVEAKGVLAMRLEVSGTSAHGSTPWEGDNAVVKAVDIFKRIESLPFARESSDLFDRPSINLGRIIGGDALNRVPEMCVIDVDVRYLPGQDPEEILRTVRELPDVEASVVFQRRPINVDRDNPFVGLLADAAVAATSRPEHISVGRHGTSDAISFLNAGVPAVEFGPVGAGHHGPEEWVSIPSLAQHRRALVEFAESIPRRLADSGGDGKPKLRRIA
jgi:succinyl-diaminopimelate desuccinylase